MRNEFDPPESWRMHAERSRGTNSASAWLASGNWRSLFDTKNVLFDALTVSKTAVRVHGWGFAQSVAGYCLLYFRRLLFAVVVVDTKNMLVAGCVLCSVPISSCQLLRVSFLFVKHACYRLLSPSNSSINDILPMSTVNVPDCFCARARVNLDVLLRRHRACWAGRDFG
jgi:hypothetical protein